MQVYLDIDEVVGDGDGVPETGETIDLTVDVLNEGNGDAEAVTREAPVPDLRDLDHPTARTRGVTCSPGTSESGSGGFRFVVNSVLTHAPEARAVGHLREPLALLARPVGAGGHGLAGGEGEVDDDRACLERSCPTRISGATTCTGPSRSRDRIRRRTSALVEGSSYFANKGLEENTLYHFYVVAVDSSGNVGPHSPVLSISTNPPSQSGWPLATAGGMYSSPAVADIDGDGDPELVISSDEIYAWHDDGTECLDGDGDPRTAGVFADEGVGGYRSSVAIGEVDGDVGVEIVAAAWANVGTPQSPAYRVYAWNGEDGSVLPGWPVTTKHFCWASPALADLDHDGRAEVVVPAADGYLYCWRYNGAEYMDGDSNPLTIGVFRWLGAPWPYGSPAVADIDEDHELEIIQPGADGKIYAFNPDGSAVTGWPFNCEAKSVCSPAVGDVDNDGHLEIAVASNAGKQWLLEADGTVMSGWPKTLLLEGDFPPSPVLANVNGDAYLEYIQVTSDGRVIVKNYLGNTLSGWPQLMGANCGSSPAVGDIDGDAGMEIVVGCNNGKVYGFDANGATLAGWPIQTDAEVYGSACLTDLDGDGDVEVAVGSMDGNVYVWDCAGQYEDGDGVEWGSFLHDSWRSQCYAFELPTGVDDGDDPGRTRGGARRWSRTPRTRSTR